MIINHKRKYQVIGNIYDGYQFIHFLN